MKAEIYRLDDKEFKPNEHDLYFLFGLNSAATLSEIKRSYRRLTHKYHPDYHDGDRRFQEAYKIINAIYSILNDQQKRREYDERYRRIRMINWKFNPDNYKPKSYELVPPGDYRVRIENAEEQTSRTGKQMIKMTLKVSGYEGNIWEYIVLNQSDEKAIRRTDNKLGRIFDSFRIQQGDLNLENWKGKVGAASIKNEPGDKGTMWAKVAWFIQRDKQDELPKWQEHRVAQINPEMINPEDEEIPF